MVAFSQLMAGGGAGLGELPGADVADLVEAVLDHGVLTLSLVTATGTSSVDGTPW